MEMDAQERESDVGEDSPDGIHNDEEASDADREDIDACEAIRRHNSGILAEHSDVLAKLKMQVRDIKVGEDFDSSRHLAFPTLTARGLSGHPQEGFHLPAPFPFSHPATPFMPPLLQPPTNAPSSGSSHSSEGSASSQHTWSFEEQFKQLYEINDDPKRKEFLDDLFSFMQKRGTPINRLPIMAKSVLDLYELYNLVIVRGGLVEVINKKLWQEIIKGLHLPSSITSAAFTLRTQYMKYLYPYECEKRHLSSPSELQAAIDGNRREGRRTGYNQYDSMQRSPSTPTHPAHQMSLSPLSLVTQQQQQQLAARMSSVISNMNGSSGGALSASGGGSVHLSSHPQTLGHQMLNGGPLPGLSPHEFESRMLEYVKLLNKEMRNSSLAAASSAGTSPRHLHHHSVSGGGDMSPPPLGAADTSPLSHLDMARMTEMSRMTLWNLYNNNATPTTAIEPQKEALNLSDTQQHLMSTGSNNSSSATIKRESSSEYRESSPPTKKHVRHSSDEECVNNNNNSISNKNNNSKHQSMIATHIKIDSRGDTRNGDNRSLVVTMELNGTVYEGVLFAQGESPSSGRTEVST